MQRMVRLSSDTVNGEGRDQNACTLERFTSWLQEIYDQPPWRAQADKVADYIDGNQLDAETLRDMQAIGMPVITENLIAPALSAVKGMEAMNKLDWRVTPDGVDSSTDDLADAMSHKLNEVERMTNADDAISDAYAAQVGPGIGWVEVSRSYDPFAYPYRVQSVHRNEMWWDWKSRGKLLEDARWLIRRRWVDRDMAKAMFPRHAELIEHAGTGWTHYDSTYTLTEGGTSTDLALNYADERGWSIEEQEWRDINQHRVCLYECWYKVLEPALILQGPDGRVVEFDKTNQIHVMAVQTGQIVPRRVTVTRMRLCWWMGPHKLHDGPTPHPHNDFPYVPFMGYREDRTAVPYGLARAMVPMQDEVNARLSRMQWGMAAVRVTRTVGAVAMDDEQFRDEIARPDADIVLDAERMRNGGVFKVERDYQLNQQQYQRYIDARDGIQRVAGIFNSYMGKGGEGVTSGIGLQALTNQSSQNLADINDNMRYARRKVGELLLSMVIADMGARETVIDVPAGVMAKAKQVPINQPAIDPDTGVRYLNNDISRIKMKVILSDVPSTSGYRGQQLMAMSEIVKSLPPPMQMAVMPFVMELADTPNKREMIRAIKQVLGQGDDMEQITPEMVQQQIEQAVVQALQEAGYEDKAHERQFKAQELQLKAQELMHEDKRLALDTFEAKAKAHVENLKAEADWTRAEIERMRADLEAAEKNREPQVQMPPDQGEAALLARINAEKDIEVARINASATPAPQAVDLSGLEKRLSMIDDAIRAIEARKPETDPALLAAVKALATPKEIPAPVINVTVEKGGAVKKSIDLKTDKDGKILGAEVTEEEE